MNPAAEPDPDPPVTQSVWSGSGQRPEDDSLPLLQEMAEEDEDIDLYNEETFGLDLESGSDEGDPTDLLLFCGHPEPLPASAPAFSEVTPRVQPASRPGGRRPVFDDPAVVRTVEGRPSLQSLDSAIVDSSVSSAWGSLDPDSPDTPLWLLSPQETPHSSQSSILQDKAIIRVIDRPSPARIPPTTLDFLSPAPRCFTAGSPSVKRGPPSRGSPQSYGPRYLSQSSGFLSPSSPNLRTPPRPFTPKMMQLRFGALSPAPGPAAFFSPPRTPSQRLRVPGHVTQLHPQHRRILNQRQRVQRRCSDSRWDPYSHIMSEKEKQWVIRLQMIQLQSENPHLDDYYYQEYYQRLERKLAEEEMLGDRSKREPPKLTTPYVTKTDTYQPVVHIEGSLGQVAVSTCFSPRRAIDAVHAHTSEEEQKDTRQQRLSVLHSIEQMYMMLLEVEEGERKAALFSEEERQRLRDKRTLRVQKICGRLQRPLSVESRDEFLPYLLVAKGKRLVARLLPFLSHESALQILTAVTTHLPVLMARDTPGVDESLPVLYPALCVVIGGLTFTQLIGVLKSFTAALPDCKDTRLSLACQNKFGISLLYALLSQGERLLSSNTPMEPSIGDFEIWTDTVFQVAHQLSQCSLVEPLLLPSNLLSLFCRYLDKNTVHQLEDSMERSTAVGCPAVPS
ncbi:protein PAT1 homolog 2 isoform X2 [Lepisosteus oculatus]|uniref:protein PAT1 homolog 2 isoform X2 n=1 Tax=Lepisosteus oculatus TaxID=7918 RepID=UPI00371E826D